MGVFTIFKLFDVSKKKSFGRRKLSRSSFGYTFYFHSFRLHSVIFRFCLAYHFSMRLSRLSSGFCGIGARKSSVALINTTSSTSTTSTSTSRFLSSPTAAAPIHPRAAVAATVQWTCPATDSHHYLLVQRKNPPDAGRWSPAGGKINLGEGTLEAIQRELEEETQLSNVTWHPNPFLTTDAIFPDDTATGAYKFHYVIAHCFAKAPESSEAPPTVLPSDDALDAQWYTLEEIENLDCSEFTLEVLERAEALSRAGLLVV